VVQDTPINKIRSPD